MALNTSKKNTQILKVTVNISHLIIIVVPVVKTQIIRRSDNIINSWTLVL